MRRSRASTRSLFRVTVQAVTTTSRAGEADVEITTTVLAQELPSLDLEAVVKAVNGIE